MPVYDFTTHQRSSETRRVPPADVVIIEGILVLHMEVRASVGLGRRCASHHPVDGCRPLRLWYGVAGMPDIAVHH